MRAELFSLLKSVYCIQLVAYQSSGNEIKGQLHPLSLAALGIGASGDGVRAIKTFRSSGSSVAICSNLLNSARMGRYPSCSRSTPKIAVSNHVPEAPIANYDRRVFGGLLPLGTLSQGLNWSAGIEPKHRDRRARQDLRKVRTACPEREAAHQSGASPISPSHSRPSLC